MSQSQKYSIELHIVGKIKVAGMEENSDELAVGQITSNIGMIARMECTAEELYGCMPHESFTFVEPSTALVAGMTKMCNLAVDMVEDKFKGNNLFEAVRSGKLESFGLKGEATAEILSKLDAIGLRPILPIVAANGIN